MAQQEGPFAEYLQQAKMTPQVQVPPITGLEGTGAAIGNIAMNFINGLRQGRQQKYMQQQMEEQKKFDAYQNALQTVAASDLPDAEKQALQAKLSMPLVQRIAGDKEASSKKTGNPLTDVLKNVALGLVGGQVPKKTADLPMDTVVEALQMASDPNRSKTRIQSQLDGQASARISEILKTQPGADIRTFMSDPELRSVYSQAQQVLGPSAKLPSIEKAYAEFRPMTEMERLSVEKAREQQAAAKEYTGATQVPPQAPTTTAIPSVTAPTAPVTAPPPTSPTPAPAALEGVISIPVSKLEEDRTLAIRAGMPTRESRGEPKTYLDQKTGETFQGFVTSGRSGFGIYRPDKQALYTSGARELSASELTRPTPAQVEKVYNTSVKALETSVSPKIYEAYKGLLESQREQGDIKGMDNVMGQAIAADRSEKEHQSRMAMALDSAASRKDARLQSSILRLDSQVQRNGAVKDYNTTMNSSNAAMKALSDARKDGNYGLADLLLIRAIAKLTDITTGVREGEYESFAAAKGRLSAVKTEWNNLLKDKADRLDDKSRSKFTSVLNDLISTASKNYNTELGRYKNIGSKMGIPSEDLELVLPQSAPGGSTPIVGAEIAPPPRDRGAKRGQQAKKPADI
jgi:hypothetical protein